MKIRSLIILTLCCFSALGCQRRSVLDGPPPPPIIEEDGNSLIYVTRFAYDRAYVSEDHPFYREHYMNADNSMAARNEIIFDLIAFVDTAHSEYEVSLRFQKAFQESGFDITEAALTLAATVAGGEQTKTVLSAINLFVQGTEQAIDKAFFKEKVVEALQLESRKNRAVVLAEIYERLDKDVTVYPLDAGMRDIARLYYAGSVTRAIQTLTETASDAAQEKEKKALQAKPGFVPPKPD